MDTNRAKNNLFSVDLETFTADNINIVFQDNLSELIIAKSRELLNQVLLSSFSTIFFLISASFRFISLVVLKIPTFAILHKILDIRLREMNTVSRRTFQHH